MVSTLPDILFLALLPNLRTANIPAQILGVPDDDIVDDYALTSAGIAPLFPLLFRKFQDIAVYRENWDGLLKMGGSK